MNTNNLNKKSVTLKSSVKPSQDRFTENSLLYFALWAAIYAAQAWFDRGFKNF